MTTAPTRNRPPRPAVAPAPSLLRRLVTDRLGMVVWLTLLLFAWTILGGLHLAGCL